MTLNGAQASSRLIGGLANSASTTSPSLLFAPAGIIGSPRPILIEPSALTQTNDRRWVMPRPNLSGTSEMDAHIEREFHRLKEAWIGAVRFESSMSKIVQHPAYRAIIALGERAVPLILHEFLRRPNHWSWALTEITGESPVPGEVAGDLDAIRRIWVRWGRDHGYL